MRPLRPAWLLALLLAVTLLPPAGTALVPAVLADDDDDDDDDDGGSGGGGGSSAGPGEAFHAPQVRRSRPSRRAVELPVVAPGEVVVRGLVPTARDALVARGYVVAAETGAVTLLTVPDDTDVEAAIAAIVALAPGAVAAPNAYYRNQQAEPGCDAAICDHWAAMGLDTACAGTPFIGIVDTGVNTDHEALADADIAVERFGADPEAPSDVKHGTAVAALLVGGRDSRTPGLLPDARLLVADPFAAASGDIRADAFGLVTAIDALVVAEVDVINLSLAGPDNAVLRATVVEAAAAIPLVAAVGNAGPNAGSLYPAGYDEVIAVTALDRRGRVYRRAVQGGHVDFAAPGVEVPTAASIRGMRPQTGTSFAVPFVTAALATARLADPEKPLTELVAALQATAADLGETGRDDVFGWGRVALGC